MTAGASSGAPAGVQLALDGQNTALAAATVGYHQHPKIIDQALTELVKSGREFSADHVRAQVPPETVAFMDTHPNVLPALFGQASRSGRITQVGWCKPSRRTRHSNPNRTWTGTRI